MRLACVPTILLAVLLNCSVGTDHLTTSFKSLNPEEIQKVIDALPERPSVQPRSPRKLLVFSLAWGYKHESAQWGKPVFDLMAKKSGAFEAVFSDDPAMFEPKHIKQFDAVLFNNTNNEIFMPEFPDSLSDEELAEAVAYDKTLKASFTDYLQHGGGLAVLHAGLASFREWPEFGNLIGARFDNHPWNEGNTVTIKKNEPDHPLVQAFTSDAFGIKDEIYQFKEPYSRRDLKVLLSLDTARTDMTVPNIHRTDGDFPMSWIKTYGEGRIFYCALGHMKHIFWDREILHHWLDGIQFVLGDLDCDVTPSAEMGNRE